MGRSKTLKFADNEASANVVQPGNYLFGNLKNKWKENYFKNVNDIVVELACGRGEYTVGLAEVYPNKNFVGVDIKGSRIWTGSQRAQKAQLNNVAFLRIKIQSLVEHFSPDEISDIWIIHPDPRPKESDEHRRLTHPRFLEIYKQLLAPGGWVRIKTDNTGLFDYTMEVLQRCGDIEEINHTTDLDNSEFLAEHHSITTRYEKEFKAEGFRIKYLKFSFKNHSSKGAR